MSQQFASCKDIQTLPLSNGSQRPRTPEMMEFDEIANQYSNPYYFQNTVNYSPPLFTPESGKESTFYQPLENSQTHQVVIQSGPGSQESLSSKIRPYQNVNSDAMNADIIENSIPTSLESNIGNTSILSITNTIEFEDNTQFEVNEYTAKMYQLNVDELIEQHCSLLSRVDDLLLDNRNMMNYNVKMSEALCDTNNLTE